MFFSRLTRYRSYAGMSKSHRRRQGHECECLGDFTNDGTIGFEDVLYLLSNWGSPNADLNGGGTTDFEDLLVILSVWGTC